MYNNILQKLCDQCAVFSRQPAW